MSNQFFNYFCPILITNSLIKMKKIFLSIAALALIASTYSCRETTVKVDDTAETTTHEVENVVEDAADAVEEAAEDTGDAIDNAADNTADAIEDATDGQ